MVGTPDSSTVLYNKFRVIFLTTACVFHVATAPFGRSHAVLLYCLIATTQRHYTQRLLQPLSGKRLKNTRIRSKKDCKLNIQFVHFKLQIFFVEVSFPNTLNITTLFGSSKLIRIKFFLLFKSYVLFENC